MAAYAIVDVNVLNPAEYERYKQGVPATLARYGGRFVVRGGAVDVLEGDWRPKRLVVLEFPDMKSLRAWYDSPEYTPLKELRERTAESRFLAVEGV